ncbi:hypothetical protein [Desulfosporosinus sp. SB140]|uniref:hypothetical protein n=1 Tax=Desulfosporosinus paludis TaxID=3115649 RepID=UPI00388FFBE6
MSRIQNNVSKTEISSFVNKHPVVWSFISMFIVAVLSFSSAMYINQYQTNQKLKNSAKLILLELNHMDSLSRDKYQKSNQIIQNLDENKLDQIPAYSLDDQFTILSESEWNSNMLNILPEISAQDYFSLQSYHKSLQKFDIEYPLNSFNSNLNNEKENLKFWWKSFRNFYSLSNKNNYVAIETEINKLTN